MLGCRTHPYLGTDISAVLSVSPQRSDYIFILRSFRAEGAWRVVSEDPLMYYIVAGSVVLQTTSLMGARERTPAS